MEYYLQHHGIKGQKWGKRHGPPYPLGGAKYFRKYRKENKENSEYNSDNKNFLKSKQFKILLGVTLAGIGVYAATKIGKNWIINKAVGVYADRFNALPIKYSNFKDVPKCGSKYYDAYMNGGSVSGAKELLNHINDDTFPFSEFVSKDQDQEIDIYKAFTRTQNCTFCSASIIARLKGYEVHSAETIIGYPYQIIEKWFVGGKFTSPKLKSEAALLDHLKSQGNGHYGMLNVTFKHGADFAPAAVHSIAYAIRNNNVEFLDGQLQALWNHTDLFSSIDISKTQILDATNLEFSDMVLACFT